MKKVFALGCVFLCFVGCSAPGSDKSSGVLSSPSPMSRPPDKEISESSVIDLGSWTAFLSPSELSKKLLFFSMASLPPISLRSSQKSFHLVFDKSEPFGKQVLEFQKWIEEQGFTLIHKKRIRDKLPQKIILEFQRASEIFEFQIDQKVLAKVAIVIDDLGHNKKALPFLYKINRPMTLAVLPHLAYSEKLSRELHEQGYEVILHLPMENLSGLDPGPGAVNTQMNEEEIRQSIDKALKTVPQAIGANNHMGSKATQDRRVMEIVLDEFKDRNLIFLDSLTADSVTSEVAQKENLEIHSRDIFLDNEEDLAHVSAQLKLLKQKALKRGSAIGIGHFKERTLQAILEAVNDFEESGVELVFLSEFYGSAAFHKGVE
jgi:polysaccharide deacetylase 2 family uncharacterized protein YibQ